MRVAHLLYYMAVGGIEQLLLSLCQHHNREEFQFVMAAPHEGTMTREMRQSGIPVYTGPDAYKKAAAQADLINLHGGLGSAELHSLMRRLGKPYVTTLHSDVQLPELPSITICTSHHVYQRQTYKSRCVVIPNGVDLQRFAPQPRPPRKEVILTRVCRPPRCAPYFWEGIKLVLDRCPQAQLWIVGNPDECRHSSGRVRFWGIRRDIPQILAQSDIFVYTPYPTEGTRDLVAMEASAMGVPCVVSDVNSVRESIYDGKNGFLTPFGDVEQFAEKVAVLVEDISSRQRMSEEAVRIAQEQFDIGTAARRYEVVYRTVMQAFRRYGAWVFS